MMERSAQGNERSGVRKATIEKEGEGEKGWMDGCAYGYG